MKFIQWLVQNWQAVCGWITGLFVLGKLLRGFTSVVLSVSSAVKRFEQAENTLSLVATNHLPHMQWELEKTNATMTSMDQTLKKMYKQQVGDYE